MLRMWHKKLIGSSQAAIVRLLPVMNLYGGLLPFKKNSLFRKNKTWVLVKLPDSQKNVRYKQIFKKKEGIPRIESTRFNTHLVAKCYTQREGVDFSKVFLQVVKYN